MTIKHDAVIIFPNGKGQTPCSREYKATLDAKLAICDIAMGERVHDLPAAEWEEWMRLDHKLDQMLGDGHVGKSIRYEDAA